MSTLSEELSSALEIDRALTEIELDLKLLLNITPVNAAEAWVDFEKSGYSTVPHLQSRPLDFDPDLVRRRLYNLEIEEIEDPGLENLFREKRDEIAREITLLEDRDTTRFLYGSLQIFGEVGEQLVDDAGELLEEIPTGVPRDARVSATSFAEAARRELDLYKRRYPEFQGDLEVRSDVSDLMVSHGRFLIPAAATFRAGRVDPLIQHEIGTHVITYWNGAAQPLKLLTVGLPGYDETQEGLAVLAEYVAGGLDPQRIRLLAARVVAVARLLAGAEFLEIFRELHDERSFSARAAWGVTVRVARHGGLTKDVIYLRGIMRLLEFLSERQTVEPLLVGKLSIDHVPLIEDLMKRDVIGPPWIRPRWLEGDAAGERLARTYEGMHVRDLVAEAAAA